MCKRVLHISSLSLRVVQYFTFLCFLSVIHVYKLLSPQEYASRERNETYLDHVICVGVLYIYSDSLLSWMSCAYSSFFMSVACFICRRFVSREGNVTCERNETSFTTWSMCKRVLHISSLSLRVVQYFTFLCFLSVIHVYKLLSPQEYASRERNETYLDRNMCRSPSHLFW